MSGFEVMALFGVLALVGLTVHGVLRVIRQYVDRKFGSRGLEPHELAAIRAEIADMRTRVDDSDDLERRLQELEERMDFAERVLAQQPSRPGLPGGAQGA